VTQAAVVVVAAAAVAVAVAVADNQYRSPRAARRRISKTWSVQTTKSRECAAR